MRGGEEEFLPEWQSLVCLVLCELFNATMPLIPTGTAAPRLLVQNPRRQQQQPILGLSGCGSTREVCLSLHILLRSTGCPAGLCTHSSSDPCTACELQRVV